MAAGPGLCARFHRAVELIGRRWSGAVIQLLMRGPSRYAALRDAIPDISDRMLSERLQELEEEGIVIRRVIPDTPVRVEYELTPKGRALEPALGAIGRWAEHWIPDARPGGRSFRLKAEATKAEATKPARRRAVTRR